MRRNTTVNYRTNLENFINDNFHDKTCREKFLNRFNAWPSPKVETWKLSRLGELSRKNISPLYPNPSEEKVFKFDKLLKQSHSLIFVDGFYRQNLSDKLPENIEISFCEIKEFEDFLSKIENKDILEHPTLNVTASCCKNVIKIKVKKGSTIDLPIEIIQFGGDIRHSIHPLIFFELEQNSFLNIVEVYRSSSSLIAPLEMVKLSKNSKLNLVKIYDDDYCCHNLSLTIKILEEKAECKSFNLIKGGVFSRSETHVFLNGEESFVDFNGIYLSTEKQHHDFTSSIYHNVPNCKSAQKVRGVLNKHSSGVFQGKVKVAEKAQKTDASQMSKALLLSDKASSNSKPELEIYADDVVCSHGATIGELDEDQFFYLLSRGLTKQKAQFILIDAFLTELIEDSIDKSYKDEIKNETKVGFKNILKT